jgi:hypothetical protein
VQGPVEHSEQSFAELITTACIGDAAIEQFSQETGRAELID